MNAKIKYDKRTLRVIRILAIVLTVFVGLMLPWFFVPISKLPSNIILDLLMTLGLLSFWPMLAVWLLLFNGTFYLKRLARAGYEVPADRRKYGNSLDNLPRIREVKAETEGHNRQSLVLAALAGTGAAGFLVVAIKYVIQWRFVEDISFSAVCLFALAGMWCIGAFLYYRQSDNRRFLDFYLPMDSRKIRTSLEEGILTLIFVGVISATLASFPFSMTRYIEKTRVEVDREELQKVLFAARSICQEYDYCREDEWETSYVKLTEGVDFFEADWENDLFTRQLLERTGYESIDHIRLQLKAKDGHFYVKKSDGQFEAAYTYTWEYGKSKRDEIVSEEK